MLSNLKSIKVKNINTTYKNHWFSLLFLIPMYQKLNTFNQRCPNFSRYDPFWKFFLILATYNILITFFYARKIKYSKVNNKKLI